VNYFVSSTSIS